MICNCPICGTLMGQKEQGIESKCICPACQHTCDICLGSGKMMENDNEKKSGRTWPHF